MGAETNRDLQLAFDVGHSSIGWAVLQRRTGVEPVSEINILGCGVVTFGADDCLASKRRQYRQQRRHVRATSKRIAVMEKLLVYLDVVSEQKLKAKHNQAGGDSFAWQRAAEILSAAREGKPLPALSWPELWDILRWYAHNRGYFAPPWANRNDDPAADSEDAVSDSEKVKIGHDLMHGAHPELKLHTETMAETIAAYATWYEQQAALWRQGKRKTKPIHFKGLNAAFRREVIWPEVRALLVALKNKLPKLDNAFIRTLLGNDVDPMRDRDAWQAIPCPAIELPKRYHGGLLFGQVTPRFENRIIGVCPIQFAKRQAGLIAAGMSATDAKEEAAKQSKLPSKATREFLRYRWAMQLANIFGAKPSERQTRPLTGDERRQLTAIAERQGAFTKSKFIDAVREITGWPEKPPRDNLDALLLHPDAEKALVLDPVRREIGSGKLATTLDAMPEQFRKRLYGKLSRGKAVTLLTIRSWLTGADADAFDAEVQRILDAANIKRSKKQVPPSRDKLLGEELRVDWKRAAAGRAPYARPVLEQACAEVMQGIDPRAEKSASQPRGCLCQTNELKETQLQRRLEEQTNNHLIRHRLLILGGEQPKPNAKPNDERRRFKGLLHDLIQEFANGDKSRIAGMTIEVASDLRDLSGKTRKEQEQDLGLRLGDFKRVSKAVEDYCRPRGIKVTASLIRKARIANDQGWKCPYTKELFELQNILNGDMELDHIIPFRDRESNSLDSLVVTWKEINAMKKRRTAWQFMSEEQTKPVDGLARLQLLPLSKFEEHVKSLKPKRGQGHPDDRARKERRVKRLLTPTYEEKEFTPRDLTVTRHLVRLGAQVLQRAFPPEQRPPVNSIPGSVTGEVRKAWKLTGCLEAVNPAVIEEVEERNPETGKLEKVRRPKKKEEIRGITHMHHALDACVLALTAYFFPRHGTFWSAMVKAGADREADDDRRLWLAMTKRRPSPQEVALLAATKHYQQDSDGRMHMTDLEEDLKKQFRARLAEKRVIQHIPADMSGLGKRIRQNTTGILKVFSLIGEVIWARGRNSDVELDKVRQQIAIAKDSGDYRVELTAPVDDEEGEDGATKSRKPVIKSAGSLLGLLPTNGHGKLKLQRGVRELRDNFGVAILDHAPAGEKNLVIIPMHKVHARIFKGFKGKNGVVLEKSLIERNGGKMPRVIRNGQIIRVLGGNNFKGVWRVFSVKNNATGVALDIGWPDVVKLKNKTEGHKINVRLETLVKDGLEIIRTALTGITACPAPSPG